jgi:hypothetical protein
VSGKTPSSCPPRRFAAKDAGRGTPKGRRISISDFETGGIIMMQKCLGCFLFVSFVLNIAVFAQDYDLQSNVNYKINKMKTVLGLTDSQALAIRPIIKDYLAKRRTIIEETQGPRGCRSCCG